MKCKDGVHIFRKIKNTDHWKLKEKESAVSFQNFNINELMLMSLQIYIKALDNFVSPSKNDRGVTKLVFHE